MKEEYASDSGNFLSEIFPKTFLGLIQGCKMGRKSNCDYVAIATRVRNNHYFWDIMVGYGYRTFMVGYGYITIITIFL